MNKLLFIGLILATFAGLPGCDREDDAPPISKSKKADKRVKKGKAKAKKKTTFTRPYSYTSVGKRDPFRPYVAQVVRNKSASNRKRQATEEYSVNEYRLTGLVTSTSQPRALIEDPKGLGHTIRLGSRVGKNGGRVVRITSKGVTLIEEILDTQTGKQVRVPVNMELQYDDLALGVGR